MTTRVDLTRFRGSVEIDGSANEITDRPTGFDKFDKTGVVLCHQVKTIVGDGASTTLSAYFSLPDYSYITDASAMVLAVFGANANSITLYEVAGSDTSIATLTACGGTANVRVGFASVTSAAGVANAKNVRVDAVFSSAPADTAKMFVSLTYSVRQAAHS